MKKLIIVCILLFSNALFSGTPKDVGTAIELYPSGSATAPTSLFLNFRAYIDTRPDEIISITALGGTYFEFATFGLCSIDVGNFTTDWSAGETLVWEYYFGSAFFGIQRQILSEGSNSQFNMTPYAIQDNPISEISGLVLFQGAGLENVEINHSEVNGTRLQDESVKSLNDDKSREITLTQADGFYTFKEETGGEYLVEPYLNGYHFDPLSYQGIAYENITDWNFIAEMNQSGGGSGSGPGPIDIIVDPLEHNGVLVHPEVHIPNCAGDPLNVIVVVSNSNPAVPFPANVDLSFEIDVTGSTGPVMVTLVFPIVIPPIYNIYFFDGANWIPIAADWSIPGEVTFTYDFSVIRGIETFVLSREYGMSSYVSGTVLFDGSGLENVEIDYSEVIRTREVRKITKVFNENGRDVTYTNADGTYDFWIYTGAECIVTPALNGYHFTPEFYQDFIFGYITDWDFIAAMNQSGGGSGSGPGPIDIIVDPLELNGVLVQPEVHIPNCAGDPLVVMVCVSNSNPAYIIPEGVDLSFEIDVAGSTGPVTVTLVFPILAPPIQFIVFFDGANWINIAGDWSVPGEVTFTYDFSVLRGLETFVLGTDYPIDLTTYEKGIQVIEASFLKSNYPNPFNPKTFIQFNVKEGENATLTIYNIKGEVVEKTDFISSSYNYEWNAEGLSSGVYFYKLSSESYTKTSKMLLLK